jgi:hypothetical protein
MAPSTCPILKQAKWPLTTADGRSFRGKQKIDLLTAQCEHALAPTATSNQQSLFESFVDLALTDSNQKVQEHAIDLLIRNGSKLSFNSFPSHRLDLILRSQYSAVRSRLFGSSFSHILATQHWLDLARDKDALILAQFWELARDDRDFLPLNGEQLLACAKFVLENSYHQNGRWWLPQMVQTLEKHNLITPTFLHFIFSTPDASSFYTHWMRTSSHPISLPQFLLNVQKFILPKANLHRNIIGFGFLDNALIRISDAPSEATLTAFESFIRDPNTPSDLFSSDALQAFRIRCEAMILHERAGFASHSDLPIRSRIAL